MNPISRCPGFPITRCPDHPPPRFPMPYNVSTVTWNARSAFRYLMATVALTVLVALLEMLRPALNQTTNALALVLAVILIAVKAGRGPALYASILAGLSFNYFFIGPFYSLRISRPEDLVAFLVFVATAILGGQMSSRLEKRVIQTEVQQQQLERVRVDYQRASAEAAEAGELRRSEQLKTALLDAITHDLRTPLTSIKAAISTIRQKPVPGEVEQELYEVIEQEADRLNHFIQGMMYLAQLEAGRVTLDSRQVSAEAIVEDAMLSAEPLLAGHKVTISVEPDLPALRVDPRLISQVIYSLLENTARYSGPGDRIEVAVERSAENFVRFSVADEGPGIAPELRSQCFQKFFRAGGQAGFGVGLAIAHGIVHAHRGRIWIEDGLRGRGINVKFEIPAGDQA